LKHAQKSTAEDKESRIASIQSKIELSERFIKAQEMVESNPQGMISECMKLLDYVSHRLN
jgi:intraflagellar transport protein 140